MSTQARLALDHYAVPWLLATALLTVAPHFEHQPLWLSLFCGTVFIWAAWLWWSDQRLPGRWLLMLIVAGGCAAIWIEFRTLFGRDTGVALLVMLMALKLMELKSRRDAVVVVTLGYFLLLTHYFYSQSIATGLWLLVALWIVTATLIRIHGGSAASLRGCLRHSAILAGQALPFLLILYLLFPRVAGPLWGLPQDAHAGRTGLSETMAPGNISNLARSGEIAFRVLFDGALPPRDKLYWRGPVLEEFDGRTWSPYAGITPRPRLDLQSPPISYETTLEGHNQRWLLALDAPSALPADSVLSGTLTANARQRLSNRQRFRFASALDYRFNVSENQPVLSRNLQLPSGRNPRSLELARRWQSEQANPQAIIGKALELFSAQFTYTLQPPLLGEDGIDEFLFTTQRGFCEHFSAAFVVLMRAAGIPARVVTGYQGGDRNPVDGYLIVRQSDAHAWAEVWLADRGWVRVDPTAAVSPLRIETGIAGALAEGEPLPALLQVRTDWLRTLRHRWEAINNAWNQQVLGFDRERQRRMLSAFGIADADWRNLAVALAVASSLLLLAIMAWALYHRPQRDPAARLWQDALRHLARRQVHCAPWETPLALLARLRTEQPMLAEPFARVVEAYLEVRYGQASDNLATLRDAVTQLRRWRNT
jgi:transglutaminase-like putative cysteine protease